MVDKGKFAKQIAEVHSKLPWQKTPEALEARKKLWPSFDNDGTGYLSLAKVDKAIQDTLNLPELFSLEPVEIRAFNAAKAKAKKKTKYSDDFVTKSEFHWLLKYLDMYFELWCAFEQLDKDGDHRITKEEFIGGKDLLTKWGVDMSDPEKQWKQVDPHRHAHALFEEFADWAIGLHLMHDFEEDDKNW